MSEQTEPDDFPTMTSRPRAACPSCAALQERIKELELTLDKSKQATFTSERFRAKDAAEHIDELHRLRGAEKVMAEFWSTLCPDCGPADYAGILASVVSLRAAKDTADITIRRLEGEKAVQADTRNGNVLGEAFGETKREVFDKLTADFKDAHEIRIRSMESGGPSTEMPRYRCHKEVWALKIKSVTPNSVLAALAGNESDGTAVIVPEDAGFAEFTVDAAYLRKHNPQPGGYYVVYKDGYKSFSPADAFEDGYARI